MKKQKRRASVWLALLLAFVLMQNPSAVLAAAKYNYTYQIVLYAGNQGNFQSAAGISVAKASGGVKEAVIEQTEGEIRISGLEYGDRITIHPQNGMVNEANPEKYYIRGLRESGKDNNTVGASSFRVEKDIEYVIAYGIRGDMVKYTVNYLDEAGNALRDSETFYGVEGDKPVIAYQYIDGYQPQAYNLTKTLQRNEAENVFNFVYRKIVQAEETTAPETEPGGTTPGENPGGTTPGGTTPGGTTPGENPGGTTPGENPGGNTPGENPGGNTPGDNPGGSTPGGTDETQTPGETTVDNTEETQPQELIDIDDETVPLAPGGDQTDPNQKGLSEMIPTILGAAGGVLLLILLLLLLAKKKGQKEDHGKEE